MKPIALYQVPVVAVKIRKVFKINMFPVIKARTFHFLIGEIKTYVSYNMQSSFRGSA
ncbi:uncharacterized protein METZ01_LOCUS47737 [marine metagenome]|uniref:Uncharacterized protein n=1 Tax=marine metagenome TaxID=408172 RepID=A0A381S144_9ZZZZ